MIYALVSPEDAIDREIDGARLDPKAGTKPGWRWLPVTVIEPPFDSATQVRTGPVISVSKDAVTKTWAVRDKTAEELAAEAEATKEEALNSIDALQLKVLFDLENRMRALEMKQPISPSQYRAALKARL